MWLWAAAEDAAQGGSDSTPVIVALVSALGGVIASALAAVVALARRDPPAAPVVPSGDPKHGERIAVLEQRAHDNDDRDNLQDIEHRSHVARLDDVERYLDHTDPEWRA